MMFLWFCRQAMKRVKFIKRFKPHSFSPLEDEWERVSDFTSQHQVNHIRVEEQFRKYELT